MAGELLTTVTVRDRANRTQRTYKGDYAFIGIVNEDGVGCRWEQEPAGWNDGLGLFYAGLAAMKAVAEQKGNERYKVAARAALDAMAKLDPNQSKKAPKKKRAKKKSVKK